MAKSLRKMTVLVLSFALAFTALPMLDGGLSSEAKAAKKIYVSARATGYYTASISWNKISKPQSGYALFRDGVVIAHFGKKTTSYSDAGLAAGSYHTYQVKAYKKKTTKKKMWRNKYTGELRKKRPKKGKKDWKKKTIKTVKYTYKKSSNVASVSTPAKPASTAPATKPVSGGGSSGGGSTTPTTTTKTVTDFLGVTRTFTKTNVPFTYNGTTYNWTYKDNGSDALGNPDDPRYDKTQNGEFVYQGNTYKQIDGATFQVKGGGTGYTVASLESPMHPLRNGYWISAYNIDPAKLTVELTDAEFKFIDTYKWNAENQTLSAAQKKYVSKGGKLIAMAGSEIAEFDSASKQLWFRFATDESCGVGDGIGIFNDTINLKITYSGKSVGTAALKTCTNPVSDTGMSPRRRLYYSEAEKGMQHAGYSGPTGDMWKDYRAIADYIEDKSCVTYGSKLSGYGITTTYVCDVAAGIMETWMIYNYGEAAYGYSAGYKGGSYSHKDFYLNNKQGMEVWFD
jgi:hypothetical protein